MSESKTNVKTRAKNNGIVFYSNKYPFVGSETYFDGSGKIQSKLVPIQHESYLGILYDKGNKVNKKKVFIFNIVLMLFSVIVCSFTQNFGLIIAAVYFSAFVSIDFFDIIKISYSMKAKKGKNHSTAKFHAAEHMVLNAYEKFHRIPTLEEAKKCSRFYKNCESSITLAWCFIFCIIIIVMATIFPYKIFICLIILLLLPLLLPYLTFLQFIVTSKPCDDEIKLAIEGLRQFENMEERFEKEELEKILMEELTL